MNIFKFFAKPWMLLTLMSERILAKSEPEVVLDFYATNLFDGYGDISFSLNALAWINFYAAVDGLNLTTRIRLPGGNLITPFESLSGDQVNKFLNKFYGGSLVDAVQRINAAFFHEECRPLELRNLEVLGVNESSKKPTHVVKFKHSISTSWELIQALDWDLVQKIILTNEYNFEIDDFYEGIYFIDRRYPLREFNIPEFDKSGNQNKAKFKIMLSGWNVGVLTPLPFDTELQSEYLPTNIKKSGSDKVIFIYMKGNMHAKPGRGLFSKWIRAIFDEMKPDEKLTVIIPPASMSNSSFKMVNEEILSCNMGDQVQIVSTKFLPNQVFNKIIADPELDGVVVTGDQSLGSALRYLPVGKSFVYEETHKTCVTRALIDSLQPEEELSLIEHESYNHVMFRKEKNITKQFGLERKLYCELFPEALSCVEDNKLKPA